MVGRSGHRMVLWPALRDAHNQRESRRSPSARAARAPPCDRIALIPGTADDSRGGEPAGAPTLVLAGAPRLRRHHGVAAHSGPGDFADGHRAQPHLLRPVPIDFLDEPRRSPAADRLRGTTACLALSGCVDPLLPAGCAHAPHQRLRRAVSGASCGVCASTAAAGVRGETGVPRDGRGVRRSADHGGRRHCPRSSCAVERVPEPALAGDRIRAPDRRKAMVRVCGKQCPTLQWRDDLPLLFRRTTRDVLL